MANCTVCGSAKFGPGPNGRVSVTGRNPYPRCENCGALERHRIARGIVQRVRLRGEFSTYHALQFSGDPIVCPSWFSSFERSIYGGHNSMDIQSIPRRSNSCDIILCCHVIEHVPDHHAALRDLIRVLSIKGFIYLAYPSPIRVAVSRDWGYPDPNQHGHYRVIGRDFERQYRSIIPSAAVIAVTGRDEVTGVTDLHYVITKSAFWKARITALLPDARVIQ